MAGRFFTKTQFDNNFGKEMVSAHDVYEARHKSGLEDYSLAKYDFIFISNAKSKVDALGVFLSKNYNYVIKDTKQVNEYWELYGDATEFPVDKDNLMYWALDLYCKGYEFDCKLDGYGATGDPKNQKFPDMLMVQYDSYFELATETYNKRNLGMAIIHFSTAIKINGTDPNSWYSRAIVKDELYTWKSARRDYDKAIELAPDFIVAIVNRAANKDSAGEYIDAIKDYDEAIILDPQNAMAYFNRGNSKFNNNEKKAACEDWKKAKELGAVYAQERLDEHCKQKSFFNKIFK